MVDCSVQRANLNNGSSLAIAIAPSQPLAEVVSQTVLKFGDRALLDTLTQTNGPAETVLEPMQRLVELVGQLRSPEHEWPTPHPPTPETLVPYTSDEAYDVLTALAAPTASPENGPTTIGETAIAPSALVRLEDLIPKLLWSIARTAYPIMQLLEGIPATAHPANQQEQAIGGILRLVVLLRISTAETTWSLDLATRQTPIALLDRTHLIQVEDDAIGSFFEPDLLASPLTETAPEWATLQLQTLSQEIHAVAPTLQPWFAGVAVDCLIPEQAWQVGQCQLGLEFEFMPHSQADPANIRPGTPHPVEAELLDDREYEHNHSMAGASDRPWIAPIAVVEMPPEPLVATTIVRLTDQQTIEKIANLATRRELEKGIHQVRAQLPPNELAGMGEAAILTLVQEAYRISALTYHSVSPNWGLLQPELLMDELVPKLLWHVARSSYTLMLWIGGLTASVLQPQTGWMQGSLRLLLVLSLETATGNWFVDLATGRLVAEASLHLEPGAIAHIPTIAETMLPGSTLLELAPLKHQLDQVLQTSAPEIFYLLEAAPVDWLTLDHDWQPGQLRVYTSLEFIPNLF